MIYCNPITANDTKYHITTNKGGDEIMSFSYASYHDLDKGIYNKEYCRIILLVKYLVQGLSCDQRELPSTTVIVCNV